jgi:hypothetical protein
VCAAGGEGEMLGASTVQAPEFKLQVILSFGFMQFGSLTLCSSSYSLEFCFFFREKKIIPIGLLMQAF